MSSALRMIVLLLFTYIIFFVPFEKSLGARISYGRFEVYEK